MTLYSSGLKHQSVARLFKTLPKLLPKAWHAIVSNKDKAPYPTVAAVLSVITVEERELCNYCVKNHCLDMAQDCWQSSVIGGAARKLLLSHPNVEGGKWFVSLGTGGGKMAAGLPLTLVRHQGKDFFVPEKMQKFHWLPILDWTEWKCLPYAFKAPLGIKCSTKRWLQHEFCVVIAPDRAPEDADNLITVAAKHAFWDMPKTALRAVAQHVGAIYDKTSEVPDLIVAIANAVLDNPTDEQLINILRLRVRVDDEALEMLGQECAQEMLDKDEKDDVEKGKTKASEKVSVTAKIKKLIENIEKNAPPPAKGKGRGKGSKGARGGGAAAAKKKARKYPPKVEGAELVSAEDINELMPAACHVRPDTCDQSWILTYYGARKSKAWSLYSKEGAGHLLLQIAWEKAIELGFETHCPIEGIL